MSKNPMSKIVLNSLQHSLCETARLSQYDVSVVIVPEPQFAKRRRAGWQRHCLKVLSLGLKHMRVGTQITIGKGQDAVIVPDFSTEFLWLTYLFSGFRTRNVYVLVHHNVQQALHHPLIRGMLKIYSNLGYKFILNETLSPLKDLGYHTPENLGHAVLLHPVQAEAIAIAPPSAIPKVGIVGSVRKGKRFAETLALLQQLQTRLDFTLVLGIDAPEQFQHLASDRLCVMDTGSHAQYLAAIAHCDVIVLNYDESQYRYRCSGVAADAIGCRTYVVAPDYPMIRHQLIHPVPVGVLYEDESALETALTQAIALPPTATNPAFEQHYADRSAVGLAVSLDRILSQQPDRETTLKPAWKRWPLPKTLL
jgi:hypothetical protein